MKTYKKLMDNPLGLPSGIIHDETFTDKDKTPEDKVKIALAVTAGMIGEVDPIKEAQDVGVKADDAVTKLQEQLDLMTKERDDAVALSMDLKKELVAGWEDMDADELAKEFTVPELKIIADDLEVNYPNTIKEAALANKIIEAKDVLNAEK